MFFENPLIDMIARGTILSTLALIFILLLVRIVGLRTLSKMTAIDFVVTLATGSLLATAAAATDWSSFGQAVVAILMLNAFQFVYAKARRNDGFRQWAENEPVILLRNGAFIDVAMAKARVTREDVMAKLREAGATDPASVSAVILETTGDLSVLSGQGAIDPAILADIRNR